jgi:hypothetical protein
MTSRINSAIKSKKGRGRPSVDTEAVNVRFPVETIAEIDKFRRNQPELPTRPEAIRQLVEKGLRGT